MDRALTPEKCCNFTHSRHCTPTCTHAINGGKQRVLLLRKAFMLHRSSSLILLLSPLGLFVSISWRIPANRELNSCLAKIGSLWRKNESVKCDQSCLFSVFGYMYCLHSCVVYLQPDRAEAVLPVLVLEVGWWGYRMVFGCLESCRSGHCYGLNLRCSPCVWAWRTHPPSISKTRYWHNWPVHQVSCWKSRFCTDVRPVALCNHVHTQPGFNYTLEGKTEGLSGFYFKVPFQGKLAAPARIQILQYDEQNVWF